MQSVLKFLEFFAWANTLDRECNASTTLGYKNSACFVGRISCFPFRSNSLKPSSASNLWICTEMVGCVLNMSLAAVLKFLVSYTIMNVRNNSNNGMTSFLLIKFITDM